MDSKMPKLTEVVLNEEGRGKELRVDGAVFPYPVGEDINIDLIARGRIKTLNVSLYAEDIRIVDAPPVESSENPASVD